MKSLALGYDKVKTHTDYTGYDNCQNDETKH